MNEPVPDTGYEGACFVCSSSSDTPDKESKKLTRRRLLTGAAGAAFGVTMAGGVPHAFAQGGTGREKPPHRDCIIEAAWVLAYENGRLTLLPSGSVRMRGDRIVEVKAGRIKGRARRVQARANSCCPVSSPGTRAAAQRYQPGAPEHAHHLDRC